MNNNVLSKIENTLNFLGEHDQNILNVEFLPSLVKFLSELFDVDYVFVDHYDQKDPDEAVTISVYNRGNYLPNFTYSIKNTPCAAVIGKNFKCFPNKLQQLFPDDLALVKMKVNSYAAIPLWNASGEPVGIIALLDHKPIVEVKSFELVLKIAAIKAADELVKYFYETELSKLIREYNLAREDAVDFKNKYSSLFERTLDGIYRSTHDGKFLDINPAMVKMFGYSSIDEMMVVDIKKELYFSEEERKSSSLESGKEEIELYRMRKKDGSEIWVEDHGLYVKNNKNEIEYHIGILRDVTSDFRNKQKLQKALLEIEKSEKQYRELIEFAPDAFFQGDLQGNIIGINNKCVSLTGYSREELLSMNMKDFFLDRTIQNTPLRYDLLKKGQTVITEREMSCKDGSFRVVEMNSKLLPNGLPISFFRDVSERKLNETALRDSEEKYKAVFNNAPLGIFHFDQNGIITDFNDEFVVILGSKRELLFGLDLLQQLKDEKLVAEVKKTMNEGSGYYEDIYTSITSGKSTPTIVHLNALRSATGAIIGGVGIVENITQRKEQEDKLHSSNQRILEQNKILADVSLLTYVRKGDVEALAKEINVSIAKAFNIQRVGVWLFNDTETELKCISQYSLMDDQFSFGEILNEKQFKNEFDFLKNEKYINANDTFKDPRTKGYINDYLKPLNITSMLDGVIRIRGKNVGVICLEYVNEKHEWQTDEIAFVCQMADQIGMTIQNSDIRKKEEELIKLSQAVEQSPSSIVITNLNGEIEYVNQKYVDLTGYCLDEVIGKTTNILKSGQTPLKVYQDLWTTITKGNSWTGELLNRKKNGELFWESLLISPILTHDGEIKYYLAVKEDVTEKKKMIGELIVAKEKAEESNRMKSAFLSTMSHELRTPLNAIIGLSELIATSDNIDKIIRYSSTITSSGYQLLSVVNDVMDISLIESGESKVRKRDTPVVRLLFEIYEMFKVEQRRMKKENIDFRFLIPSENHELILYTDQNKLKQIIINLIKNAFKFTAEGHVYYGFAIVQEEERDVVRFYVEDTGIGISKAKHELIFDSFRQVEEANTRIYGGAGIGLSVSKKTAELLGGEIWVDSEIGKGATFYFTLPINETKD
ncbi:MAG: PAS domain S-box protein [Prolixibacteraceae bacterium]